MGESDPERLESYAFIGITAILSLYILVGAYIHAKKCRYIHESLIILFVAAPFACFVPILMSKDPNNRDQDKISPKIGPDVIFNYLLPPIIMSAGFNMRKKHFFKNLGYIGMFGLFGTVLSFVLSTALFYVFNGMIHKALGSSATISWDISQLMTLSATMVATDTIAPLTLIDQNKAPRLFSIIFGEGVNNDAVALIIMNVVLGVKDSGNFSTTKFASDFFLVTLKSVGFGTLMGFISCLFHKNFQVLNKLPEMEASLIFIMSLLTYALCELEVLNLAAIVAIFVFGIIQSHYNRYNLSSESVEKAGFTFSMVSYICEALILIYLGLSMDVFQGSTEIVYYALVDFFILFSVRILVTFSLGLLANGLESCKKKGRPYKPGYGPLRIRDLVLISFSGMIRGSIAYALIVKLANYNTKPGDTTARTLTSLCQIMIIASMYLYIPINQILFNVLLYSKTDELNASNHLEDELMNEERDTEQQKQLLEGRVDLVNKSKPGFKVLFKRLDELILKPILIRDYEKRCLKIDLLKHKEEIGHIKEKQIKLHAVNANNTSVVSGNQSMTASLIFDPVTFKRSPKGKKDAPVSGLIRKKTRKRSLDSLKDGTFPESLALDTLTSTEGEPRLRERFSGGH